MPEEQQTLMLDDIHVVDFSQYLAGAGVSPNASAEGARERDAGAVLAVGPALALRVVPPAFLQRLKIRDPW